MDAFVITRVAVFTVHIHDSAPECGQRLLSSDVKNIPSPCSICYGLKTLF